MLFMHLTTVLLFYLFFLPFTSFVYILLFHFIFTFFVFQVHLYVILLLRFVLFSFQSSFLCIVIPFYSAFSILQLISQSL